MLPTDTHDSATPWIVAIKNIQEVRIHIAEQLLQLLEYFQFDDRIFLERVRDITWEKYYVKYDKLFQDSMLMHFENVALSCSKTLLTDLQNDKILRFDVANYYFI